jgi:hypothetical protein
MSNAERRFLNMHNIKDAGLDLFGIFVKTVENSIFSNLPFLKDREDFLPSHTIEQGEENLLRYVCSVSKKVGNPGVSKVAHDGMKDVTRIVTNFSDVLEEYVEGKPLIKECILKELGNITEEMLLKNNINPQQFVLKISGVDVKSSGTCDHFLKTRRLIHEIIVTINIEFGVIITISFTLEDVSVFEPSEIEAQRLRYNNYLNGNYSGKGLEEWVEELGTNSGGLTKEEMCNVVKRYYGF